MKVFVQVVFRADLYRKEFKMDFVRFMGRRPKSREVPSFPFPGIALGDDLWDRLNDPKERGDDSKRYRARLPWCYSLEIEGGAATARNAKPQKLAEKGRPLLQDEEDLKLQRGFPCLFKMGTR